MSSLLGLGSFLVAQLPLSFAFSNSATSSLSNFGTGLLLGAALGVVLPEGIEVIMAGKAAVPVTWIAVSLIMGFAFMFMVEHLTGSDHSHPHSNHNDIFNLGTLPELGGTTEDAHTSIEQGELARHHNIGSKKALQLTVGLVVHSLADGFALGASALSDSAPVGGESHSSELSLVVFLALLIHKAPAALALTTSLLMTPLSRSAIRRHLAIFAASTPAGAILTYIVLDLLGSNSGVQWTGQTLLFSAGTFLYVATVLQPVASHESVSSQGSKKLVNLLICLCGMFLPLGISLMVKHDHGAPPGGEIPGGIQISS